MVDLERDARLGARRQWPRLMVARSLTVLDPWLGQLPFARSWRRSVSDGDVVLAAIGQAFAHLEDRLDQLESRFAGGAGGRVPHDASDAELTSRAIEREIAAVAGPMAGALAKVVERLDSLEAGEGEARRNEPPFVSGAEPAPLVAVGRELQPVESGPGGADRAAAPAAGDTPARVVDVQAYGRTSAQARARALDMLGLDDGDAEVEIVTRGRWSLSRRCLARARVRPLA
ncbi:MAG: hypothetical protein ACRD1K_20085 [Acidimicrobiales bacterium]